MIIGEIKVHCPRCNALTRGLFGVSWRRQHWYECLRCGHCWVSYTEQDAA